METEESHRGKIVRKRVDEYLARENQNLTQLAEELGMSRKKLYYQFDRSRPSLDFVISVGQKIGHDFSREIPEMRFYEDGSDDENKSEIAIYKQKLIEAEQEKIELYQKIIRLNEQIVNMLSESNVSK